MMQTFLVLIVLLLNSKTRYCFAIHNGEIDNPLGRSPVLRFLASRSSEEPNRETALKGTAEQLKAKLEFLRASILNRKQELEEAEGRVGSSKVSPETAAKLKKTVAAESSMKDVASRSAIIKAAKDENGALEKLNAAAEGATSKKARDKEAAEGAVKAAAVRELEKGAKEAGGGH